MQTFLPYADFNNSLQCLDYRRAGKQRVEAMQIYKTIMGESKGWRKHPIVIMWKKYPNALALYHNITIEEWVKRGYNNNMKKIRIKGKIILPSWFGNQEFHASHRSNLLRKNHDFYSRYGWEEPDNLPYIWFQ
ncbi:MAG: pyrimidine dimer DNA glycosylase/endonuclease V [Elusimicrobiota bacterium]